MARTESHKAFLDRAIRRPISATCREAARVAAATASNTPRRAGAQHPPHRVAPDENSAVPLHSELELLAVDAQQASPSHFLESADELLFCELGHERPGLECGGCRDNPKGEAIIRRRGFRVEAPLLLGLMPSSASHLVADWLSDAQTSEGARVAPATASNMPRRAGARCPPHRAAPGRERRSRGARRSPASGAAVP